MYAIRSYYVNVKCGIMDQFSVAMGKKDHAILLDTSNLWYRYVPLAVGEYRIVVMNTNKKRELADSKYNERLGECMAGLAELKKYAKIESLCELTPETFAPLESHLADATIRRRVRHCVTENARVNEAVAALEAGNLKRLGELLVASHVSLRDDYEVTGLELDTLFEEANAAEGRITSYNVCYTKLLREQRREGHGSPDKAPAVQEPGQIIALRLLGQEGILLPKAENAIDHRG